MKKFIFDIQRFRDTTNTENNTLITGTDGDDNITNLGENVTIDTKGGNDVIIVDDSRASAVILYKAGEGNDTIVGYTNEDNAFNYQLQISGSAYTSAVSGSNVVLGVGSGSITVKDGVYWYGVKGINIVGSYKNNEGAIDNSNNNVNIYGTSNADSIDNKGHNVSIHAYGGDDKVIVSSGANVYVDAGDGTDLVYLTDAGNTGSTIFGGAGEDYLSNGTAESVSFYGGDDADNIYNGGAYATIDAGIGNDTIENSGSYSCCRRRCGHSSQYRYESLYLRRQ